MIVIKTFVISTDKIKRNWYIVDATDKILGRLSTKVAKLLIGKHKVEYTPNIDLGDYVIIINAKNVSVTGKKFNNKVYYRHTGYIGGIKKFSFRELINRNPKKIIEISVKGMLPKGHLGRVMYRKLKVYSGNVHKHQAQNPKILNF